jgi:hypothetical protein
MVLPGRKKQRIPFRHIVKSDAPINFKPSLHQIETLQLEVDLPVAQTCQFENRLSRLKGENDGTGPQAAWKFQMSKKKIFKWTF